MSILLPTPRLPNKAVPRLLDFGANQRPSGGGVIQRLNRLGNRYELEITYPRLKPEPDGRILISRIRRALVEGALFPVQQPGLLIGVPGAPVVNGGGQAGSSLSMRGFAAGYTVREGQFFSVVHGGQRFLHEATADTTASDLGLLTIPIQPMLRISPADGETCEITTPLIEGVLGGNSVEIEQTIAKALVPALTITERA